MAIARRRWQADQAGVGVDGLSGLVVSPTRELAAQTSRCLDRLTTRMRIRGALLTKSTAAGTDFSKVRQLCLVPRALPSHPMFPVF